MLKPFRVNEKLISQENIDYANKLGLSISCVRSRIANMHWDHYKACHTPQIKNKKDRSHYTLEIKPKQNSPANGPVKTYFLSPEELADLRKKYGEPGQLIKDYGNDKAPIVLKGAWDR